MIGKLLQTKTFSTYSNKIRIVSSVLMIVCNSSSTITLHVTMGTFLMAAEYSTSVQTWHWYISKRSRNPCLPFVKKVKLYIISDKVGVARFFGTSYCRSHRFCIIRHKVGIESIRSKFLQAYSVRDYVQVPTLAIRVLATLVLVLAS